MQPKRGYVASLPTQRGLLHRDAGADEVALLLRGRPNAAAEIIAHLEQMARDFVEPASKL